MPPAAPVVVPHVAPPPLEAPKPLAPARWIEAGGSTLVGPEVDGGTLVLLGGRRALVARDGSVRGESVRSPEPLLELAEVPTAKGKRVVGRGAHTVYRFDDPLGAPVPLARIDDVLGQLGTAPGLVALWAMRSDLPRFVDVLTGETRTFSGLPGLPPRSIAFVNEREGAALFEAAGPAVTTDGGATWKVVNDRGSGDALRASGLRRQGATLRVFTFNDGPDAPVDLASGVLGRLEPLAAPPSEPSLLHWIRVTGRDPLDVAAESGVEAPPGGALIASHGLVARVDPRDGALLEIRELARPKWANACTAGRAVDGAWVACTLSDDQVQGDIFDPFGVLHVALGGPTLTVDRPAVVRNGEGELRVSPSGGALLLGSCRTDDPTGACVRQPDGKWITVRSLELSGTAAGPLRDGRVAFLRGLDEGEPESDTSSSAAQPGSADEDAKHERKLRVALLDSVGKERELPPLDVPTPHGDVTVQSPIEEDADHVLHFVVENGDMPYSIIQPLEHGAATVVPINGAVAARLHAGRGIAIGNRKVLATLDGGASWSEVAPPPHGDDDLDERSKDDPDGLVVGELGAKVGSMLRLGWGAPEDATRALDKPAAAPTLAIPRRPPVAHEHALACKAEGPSGGTPPLSSPSEMKQLFVAKELPKGIRRESSTWSSGRSGLLDTVASFEEQGSDQRGGDATTWTLRWLDPTELGAKVHVWTGPAMAAGEHHEGGRAKPNGKGAPWGATLRFAAASGGRGLFALRSEGKVLLVRTQSSRAAVMTEVAADLAPSGDVVFAADGSDVVAWTHEGAVVAWAPGEAPRRIAAIATHAVRALGQPTRDGVPVLVGATDWSMLRVFSIPRGDKGTAPPTLEGWAVAANVLRDLAGFPPCAGQPRSPRFLVPRSTLRADLDGVDSVASQSLYDVRLEGGSACVAAVSALVSPMSRAADSKRGPAAGFMGFVRADLLSKRAEGGERGVAASPPRRLYCTLAPRR